MNRVLFVDDEPSILAGLRRMLRSREGMWNMRFVEGPAAALEVLEREPVEVVVSDFRMPGLDGGQLLGEVRRRHPDTARLILSGHTAEKDLLRVVTTAHQFLTKPSDRVHLETAVERALRLRQELVGSDIRAEVSGIDALPSPPSTFLDLVEALEAPECDARRVARVLEGDVALSTKMLQLVNSSFFAPGSRITSLEAAVVRLGIQTIRSIVLIDEVVQAFRVPEGVSSHWLTRFNDHALETARLARRLAAPEVRDDAFCAGLLHECGQLVFAVCRPGVFAAHLQLREQDGRPLVDIERETFGVTHAQAGAYLLSLWGFPVEIVEAIAHHADVAPLDAPGPLSAANAVRLAHRLIETERICLCAAPGDSGASDGFLERTGRFEVVRAWRAERASVKAAS